MRLLYGCHRVDWGVFGAGGVRKEQRCLRPERGSHNQERNCQVSIPSYLPARKQSRSAIPTLFLISSSCLPQIGSPQDMESVMNSFHQMERLSVPCRSSPSVLRRNSFRSDIPTSGNRRQSSLRTEASIKRLSPLISVPSPGHRSTNPSRQLSSPVSSAWPGRAQTMPAQVHDECSGPVGDVSSRRGKRVAAVLCKPRSETCFRHMQWDS